MSGACVASAEAGITTQLPLIGVADGRRRQSRQDDVARSSAWDPALRRVQISWDPNDRLTILYGHSLVSRLSLFAAFDRVLSGEPVVYLDGAHTFDPFVIGRLARARRLQPRKVLAMIHAARAFSGHQMERLLSNCLAGALERYQARTAVMTGLVEGFSDDSLSERDIVRLSDRMLESISHLTQQGFSLLCPCPAVPMPTAPGHRLFTGLRSLADRSIRVQEMQGKVMVEEDGFHSDGPPFSFDSHLLSKPNDRSAPISSDLHFERRPIPRNGQTSGD